MRTNGGGGSKWYKSALSLASEALDRAESSLGLEEEEEYDENDVLCDPRVLELEANLRSEFREELDLQREAFETRIRELEASSGGSEIDEVAEAVDKILRSRGASTEGTVKERVARCLEKTDLEKTEPRDFASRELETLRERFEASRKSHELRVKELSEVAASARSHASAKANDAEKARSTAKKALQEAEMASEKIKSLEMTLAEAQRQLREEKAKKQVEQPQPLEKESRDSKNLRMELDETKALLLQAVQTAEKLRVDEEAARNEVRRAEASRANLEKVLRTFQKQDRTFQKQEDLDLEALKGENAFFKEKIETLQKANEDFDRKLDKTKDDLARAQADARTANAAATTAVREATLLKERLKQLRTTRVVDEAEPPAAKTTKAPGPPQRKNSSSSETPSPSSGQRRPRGKSENIDDPMNTTKKGFAALFLDYVDEELAT